MTDLEFLLKVLELKDENRSGWELRGVEDPESVADHSWGTALLCLLYSREEGVDADRSVKIGLVHDVAEAVIGDIAIRAEEEKGHQDMADEEKRRKEKEAMEELLSMGTGIPADEVEGLWREYEEGDSEEAVFARDMNLIDMCLQALVYEEGGRYDKSSDNPNFDEYENMDAFFSTAERRMNTVTGKKLFEEIHERYEEVE